MSVFHNNALIGASGQAGAGPAIYSIERSLRFNSSDSAYCSRVPSTAGNRKTWTWAGWVKRSALTATRQTIFRVNTPVETHLSFSESAQGNPESLMLYSGGSLYLLTTPVFRDVSAWYHIVVAVDTTDGTSSNRAKLYVNGTQVTTFNTATYPAQNFDTGVNTTNIHYLAASGNANEYFSGYLADVHFIDGQALDPTSFTEVDATTGQLVPKAYSGSFGTNGFWLKFSDNSAATATTLGKDYSGNSNNWTPNNLSVTAGAGNDSLVDTPTNYGTDTGVGGEVRGNYATWNPLAKSNATLSNGSLDASNSNSATQVVSSSIIPTFKCYWEVSIATPRTGSIGGIHGVNSQGNRPDQSGGAGIYLAPSGSGGGTYVNGVKTAADYSATSGDVIGFAFDPATRELIIYRNGASVGTLTAPATSNLQPVSALNQDVAINVNFGQRPFAYTAPSGFKALCTTNLPTPTIADPSTVMDVKLYTGNASTQTISGLGFSPDLIWTKSRSQAYSHNLYDSVRGVHKNLFPNETGAENTDTNTIQAFNSDGFQIGSNDNGNYTNGGSAVAWTWDAGSSTVTNTQGSITSQVRANASAGFSIVSWTAGAEPYTVGHGLNVAPSMIITRSRTSVDDWQIGHASIGWTQRLFFTTAAASTTSAAWNNTAPTSTVFTFGATSISDGNMIAYCFAPVAGYSAFGSYVGNGSADGPFVYTGMRPRWVMIKRATGDADDWQIRDTSRSPYNTMQQTLFANLSNAEVTLTDRNTDHLSNGFKLRGTDPENNASGATYIYAAFAEHPFQFSRAR